MVNTKKTKDLLNKEIILLVMEETAQQKIVDNLLTKKVDSANHYDSASIKLAEVKDTLKDYRKDKNG